MRSPGSAASCAQQVAGSFESDRRRQRDPARIHAEPAGSGPGRVRSRAPPRAADAARQPGADGVTGDLSVEPVAGPAGLTEAWLSAALGREVTEAVAAPVGTGQMGACYRLELRGDPRLPTSVLAKLPTADAAARSFLHGSYAIEVTFYRMLLPSLQVRAPHVYYAAISDDPDQRGTFTLLLEDLAPAVQGDQIAGCTPAEAAAARLERRRSPRSAVVGPVPARHPGTEPGRSGRRSNAGLDLPRRRREGRCEAR